MHVFTTRLKTFLGCTVFLFLALHAAGAQDASPQQSKAVSLNVIVTDREERAVADLKVADFTVEENGAAQQIVSSNLVEVPACIGILLDNSGSMRGLLHPVTSAIFDFAKANTPANEIFLVNFNVEPYLDVNLTKDIKRIREGLDRAKAEHGTALYDAVMAATAHLVKHGAGCGQRIIILVTDGEDNSSRESLAQTISALHTAANVRVYAVGLPYEKATARETGRLRRVLAALASESGGTDFFLSSVKDTDKALAKITDQIRNQYVITFVPNNGQSRTAATVKVTTRKDLKVRTMGRPVER